MYGNACVQVIGLLLDIAFLVLGYLIMRVRRSLYAMHADLPDCPLYTDADVVITCSVSRTTCIVDAPGGFAKALVTSQGATD